MLDPENIRYLLIALKQNKSLTISQLRKWLCSDGGYTVEEANDTLQKAIKDEFLAISDVKKVSVDVLKDNFSLKLKDLEVLSKHLDGPDPYCYECHKPGELNKCSECERTFHLDCQRKDIFSSKGRETIKLKDHVPIETFLDDTSEMNISNNQDNERRSIIDESLSRGKEITSNKSPTNKLKEETVDGEKMEEKDVLCIGQVRAPKRKRANNEDGNFKNETTLSEENSQEANNIDDSLCTHCKFINKSSKLDSSNISNEEICYLLRFVFKRIASWIPFDTFSALPKSKSLHIPGKEEMKIITAYCFKYPKTLNEIDTKIENGEYKSFTELYVDFLDIQHCVGIIYGTICEEYLATEYQIKDCNYELSEIRLCRDCYRRSNDKNYINDWFSRPCVPRHELVYAKKTPWPFWPAKVMKYKDNKYDVRFFGGNHERAIIDAKFIKPIDEYSPSKITVPLRKAISEVENYQVYDQQPVGTFSFEKERVQNRTITPLSVQNKSLEIKNKPKQVKNGIPNLTPTKKDNTRQKTPTQQIKLTSTPNNKSTVTESPSIDQSTKAKNAQRSNSRRSNQTLANEEPSKLDDSTTTKRGSIRKKINMKKKTDEYYDIVKNLGTIIENMTNKDEIKNIVLETMQIELKKKNDEIEELKVEIEETKKKAWCKYCLKLAALYCCRKTSYCSLECQRLDWHEGHKFKCSHKNDKK